MAKKCFRCGSEKLVKVVPAKALVIPEIKQEVEDGTAVQVWKSTFLFRSTSETFFLSRRYV